jgi:hypothetical protein
MSLAGAFFAGLGIGLAIGGIGLPLLFILLLARNIRW